MAQPERPREAGPPDPMPAASRRPYHTPELIEYGSVAKLTQGGGMSGTDGSMMMFGCL